MTPIATIYIPFAKYHESVVYNAFRSAVEQTVECAVEMDLSDGTPAKLRNRAQNAKSLFVVFLDADDRIEPTFVEDCLRTYERGTYVYTGWNEGERVMMPRECNPFQAHDYGDGRGMVGGYHLVTTLFPTEIFKYLGGFNEELPGMEDVEFYMRAQANGCCGILCPKPLVVYNGEGETRGKRFKVHPEYEEVRRFVQTENGGISNMAGCCGVTSGAPNANLTGAQEGDIPAQTLYAPMTQTGRATGRWYPRPLFAGQVIMVDPRDVAMCQDLWKAVVDLSEIAPDNQIALREAGLI